MSVTTTPHRRNPGPVWSVRALGLALTLSIAAGCSASTSTPAGPTPPGATAPSPDPRIGLKAGLLDAGEAIWNLRLVSKTPPPREFIGSTNSDLAFRDNYVFQGNYNGFQVWDITNPSAPSVVNAFVCPASQSDVSVYRNLLFISGEGTGGRLDCGTQGVAGPVSHDRLRGIRIFDIADIRNPKYIANVQTCRGSHTHSLLVDPRDNQNVYVYVSGSAPVRPVAELAGCIGLPPSQDPNSALFRIEVIRVPLANPAAAAVVSSPRIFNDLIAPPTHGLAPEDKAEIDRARAEGKFIAEFMGQQIPLPEQMTAPMLDSIVKARGGTGTPTGADSATLRRALPDIIARMIGIPPGPTSGPQPGPTQCHDITLYPEIGLAGGACEGYGLLIDISDPVNPKRLTAASDSNFSYWHSATFNNDGTKALFSDEWGGGSAPKCRATDPKEWGADAIFTIENRQLKFRSYYKLPVAQTSLENCVAHNGSMIPIPGRDVMVQAWYQGGISIFDFTNPDRPYEIAYFDRGPLNPTQMQMAGPWSVYWYNGVMVSSEIARGLDILELQPSAFISQSEIDAAKSVRFNYLNAQGQQKFVWPATFALPRAYVDQLERSAGLSASRVAAIRRDLASAEAAQGSARRDALTKLVAQLDSESSRDSAKLRMLAQSVRGLAAAVR
ncbi:MAG: hypothetical protein WEE89_14865 [Gemmatimonadota bacterium]